QGLDVARERPRRGGVVRNGERLVGEEPVPGPETAEEDFEVGVAQAEGCVWHGLLRGLPPEDAQGLRPPVGPRPRRGGGARAQRFQTAALSLDGVPGAVPGAKSRVAAGTDADLESTVAALVDPGNRVGESTGRGGEVLDQFPIVPVEVKASGVADVPL